jgi:hypothetical protein
MSRSTAARRRTYLRLETLEDRLVPTLMGNSLFPADNPWNEKITSAPVAANSDALVSAIGSSAHLHPDFGTTWAGALNGIPYNVVAGTQPLVNVVIDAYASESDVQAIPIPTNAVIEGDPLSSSQNTSDRHLIVYDQDHNVVYETFNTSRPSENADGKWHADSEAVWDLSKDTFRTAGYTSADAAGLPILPGLVRPDEVLDQGVITHALRFTVNQSLDQYIYPASHEAGSSGSNLPRMGERFRLKASFDISGYSATDKVILQALKDYGMIVADNGSSWYLSGAPSSRWDDNDLHALNNVPGSAFEAVDLTPVVNGASATSKNADGSTNVTVSGLDFSGGAGMTKVFFGSRPATSVTVVSDTQITAVAPAGVSGTVVVTVQSPYGTSAGFSALINDPAANRRFVTALYKDLLLRTPSSTEVEGWATQMDNGLGRTAVVSAFEHSTERLGDLVDGLYVKVLGRHADATGLKGFVGWMQSGATAEQVGEVLFGSQEYAGTHTSDTAFVQSLYVTVLGRNGSTAEVAAWVKLVPSWGRNAVAYGFLTSLEFRAWGVTQMYGYQAAPSASPASLFARLLKRKAAPPSADVLGWARSSLDLASIEAVFAGSDEYYTSA